MIGTLKLTSGRVKPTRPRDPEDTCTGGRPFVCFNIRAGRRRPQKFRDGHDHGYCYVVDDLWSPDSGWRAADCPGPPEAIASAVTHRLNARTRPWREALPSLDQISVSPTSIKCGYIYRPVPNLQDACPATQGHSEWCKRVRCSHQMNKRGKGSEIIRDVRPDVGQPNRRARPGRGVPGPKYIEAKTFLGSL
ncbi:Hypothetical protein CINCED_3A001308 [Cinara cedri]|uniref:Uncharacterized protein n=1 Tax=Cinara cedri TaxID=506608 RepID=A0A5E4NEL9_9HEMI|nr:Hypothetical protein CINCED_3A001308 [Cinara cedri]